MQQPHSDAATRDAVLHCVEANPTTAQALQKTVQTFPHDCQDKFIVSHAAVTATTADPKGQAGLENMGFDTCGGGNAATNRACQAVPASTVDDFVQGRVTAPHQQLDAAVQADQPNYATFLLAEQKAFLSNQTTTDTATITTVAEQWATYQPQFVIGGSNGNAVHGDARQVSIKKEGERHAQRENGRVHRFRLSGK